ncbi:oligopeptide transporter, OPT family [candidate division GN15 bacterium]|nr:oligopeptide transporter, OPT family [candidate division GN15 bacterium]
MSDQSHRSQSDPPVSGDTYRPHVSPEASLPEFTLRSVVAGIIFGVLFGAANAYLGLLAGLTVSTSIPVAVMTVGFFRLARGFFGPVSILEANMSQTTGSASSSLASGVIFTIPALFLWGLSPSLFQLTGLAMLGGLLGILCMIPLRRFLIKKEHGNLPYPEGTACANVLIASESGGARAGNVYLGLGIGMLYKFLIGFLFLWKDRIYLDLPLVKKAQIGLTATPALLAVGYILGPRIAAIMVSGSLISWIVLIPLIAWSGDQLVVPLMPETVKTISEMSASEIWTRYIRYIGAGAVAFGGIITIVRSIPTIIESFRLGVNQMQARLGASSADPTGRAQEPRTDRDLALKWVGLGVLLIVGALALIPQLLGMNATLTMRLIAAPMIAIFGFFFVTVSSRIVGLVGVSSNPTSGMTIVTLLGISLLFIALDWTDTVGKATVLTVGTVVAVAASIAGDTSQDLKTGFLVGATPFRQQIGELIGAATSAAAVCAAVMILAHSYEFGSTELPAPQATLMKTIVEGVLSSGIPWGLVLIGVALGIVIEILALPSLPFAVGLYLPVSTMMPIFVGGLIRRFIEGRYRNDEEQLEDRRKNGILFSSGLIGGEGLLGVGIAIWAFFVDKPTGIGINIADPFNSLISLAAFALLGFILFKRTYIRDAK